MREDVVRGSRSTSLLGAIRLVRISDQGNGIFCLWLEALLHLSRLPHLSGGRWCVCIRRGGQRTRRNRERDSVEGRRRRGGGRRKGECVAVDGSLLLGSNVEAV